MNKKLIIIKSTKKIIYFSNFYLFNSKYIAKKFKSRVIFFSSYYIVIINKLNPSIYFKSKIT